jgi:hypothetical protein
MAKKRIPDAIWGALPPLFALAYALLFTRLYHVLGPGTESLATVVVLLVAGQRGLISGLIAAAGCIALHLVLGEVALDIRWWRWLEGGGGPAARSARAVEQ